MVLAVRAVARVDPGEVGDVLGADHPPLELGYLEQLAITERHELRSFDDCEDVVAAFAQRAGDVGREHLVEQQPHDSSR